MKNKRLILLSVVVFVVTFLYNWFNDQLYYSFGIFNLFLLLLLLLIIAWIFCIKMSIDYFKNHHNKTFLIINILFLLFNIFFPFRRLKVLIELNLYEEKRLQIINMVKNGELVPNSYGNITLPNNYKYISNSSEIHIYKNKKNSQIIGFWIIRGMENSSLLLYSTCNEKEIKLIIDEIYSLKKLKNNWYYIEI